jgi:hypothetical protein
MKDLYLNPTNAAGKIKLKAAISEHSWNGARANALPHDIARAPISACPVFRSALCRVTKK